MVEFCVLRCVQCQTFQVLQVTKTTKWKCKMCGFKQSVTKVYGQGSGADCRRHVQKLNSIRGHISATAEQQHLISASQTPVSSGFISPDNVTFRQQETVAGSRWSSFLEEPHDGFMESLQDDDDDGSVVAATTSWDEYRGTRNSGRKRTTERDYGFSKRSGKKFKNFHNNIIIPQATVAPCDSDEYIEQGTGSSVNHTNHAFSSGSYSNLFSSKSFAPHRLPVSSLEDPGSSLSSSYQFSTRQEADDAHSVDPNIGYPSNNTNDQSWTGSDLCKNVSVNGLRTKKAKTHKKYTKGNCKSASQLTVNSVNSKWNTFLDTQHDDDDDDLSCEDSDNMADSQLQKVSGHSLSVAAGPFRQEKQFADIHRHSSVHCPHESEVQSNLESQSGGWLQVNQHSDWLKESQHSDWLKESRGRDGIRKSEKGDWLKENKNSSRPTDSAVEQTDVNCTHVAMRSSSDLNCTRDAMRSSSDLNCTHDAMRSSSCKPRGTFDLGFEIFDEDLQL